MTVYFELLENIEAAVQKKKWMISLCVLSVNRFIFFYTVKKEVPTPRKLQAVAKTELEFDCSLEHLRKIIKSLGFSFKKCQSMRTALIEKTHISAKREEYLDIIMKNRDLLVELQKDIIYIDESYIYESYKVKKCCQFINIEGVQQNVSKGKRYIIVHAGSEKGFVPNCLLIFSGKKKMEDYHSEINAHNFTK
ncbi:unnamed protein product [Euphydryas editha]|uniref:Transposase n=1 Tax=Euphydryas editha TaxID=104508 RepID=A0AAU9UTH1_EUPED|nr:unnamed protein product [Euphydryas editha]